VGLGGLEPPTSPLSGVRSNHLSYRPGKDADELRAVFSGGASRDRTDDPLLAKQVLSQLSYGPGNGQKPSLRDDKTAQTQKCGAVSVLSWIAGVLCGRLAVMSPDSKGGDPAAPSDTATLLRLHPSH
jgi:hypothetical protein